MDEMETMEIVGEYEEEKEEEEEEEEKRRRE